MDDAKINAIVEAVIQQLIAAGAMPKTGPDVKTVQESQRAGHTIATGASASEHLSARTGRNAAQPVNFDLPDPNDDAYRYRPGVKNPIDPAALPELIKSTSARIGVGRAGPRYRTPSLLLFQADHAITQDALHRDIDPKLLEELGLFSVQTRITGGKEQYLLRPDLGRQLSDEAKKVIAERCVKSPNIQLVVGDGLSAAAIEANLRQIFPVMVQGFQSAGLSIGTPFYVKYCRVGVMNDIGEVIKPDVVILLIGERPGLGRAESMSAYMGYKPQAGDNDADRDVVCNIYEKNGTNPLEAGAFIVQLAQKMLKYQASGVKLKLATK
ncbi:MAG: ethanolamine ammonia-lyase subunit EutC [Bellilinea sp.]